MDAIFIYSDLNAFLKMLPMHKDVDFSSPYCEDLVGILSIDTLDGVGKIKIYAVCDNCHKDVDFYIKLEG